MSNFEFLKGLSKTEEVVEESVEDTSSSQAVLALASELVINVLRTGQSVRVAEGHGFDSGRTGTIISKSDKMVTILDESTETEFEVDRNSIERVISESDLANTKLAFFFESVVNNIFDKLLRDTGCDDSFIDKVLETVDLMSIVNESMIGHTFDELKSDEFVSGVVESVQVAYPKLSKGILAEEPKYTMLKPVSEAKSNKRIKGEEYKMLLFMVNGAKSKLITTKKFQFTTPANEKDDAETMMAKQGYHEKGDGYVEIRDSNGFVLMRYDS